MKRTSLFISCLLCCTSLTVLRAQEPGRPSNEDRQMRFEEMRTRQLAFFTAEMDMTGEEAGAFWSIYSDIQQRRMKLNFQKRRALYPREHGPSGERRQPQGQGDRPAPQAGRPGGPGGPGSDGRFTPPPLPEDYDFDAAVATLTDIRQQEAALDEECYQRLSEVLSPEKLFKFYRAEELWTRSLLNNFDRK